MKEETRSLFFRGLKNSMPIGVGYLAVSFGFGIFAKNSGLSILEVLMISMFNLTSAGQLAAVPIICVGGSFAELALSQLVINLRYALMSISLSQKYDKEVGFPDRMLTGFAVTDEIYAVEIGEKGTLKRTYLFSMMILPWIGWTLGTLLGAVAGAILPEIVTSCLGLMLYAMFIAIVIPAGKADRHVAVCIAISIALSCLFRYLPFLSGISSGFVVIICALVCGTLCALLFPIAEETTESEVAADA